MMSWLMGLLLVCSGPLASGCDAACQLHGPHSCCRSVVSSACGMLRCSSSRACNGIARQQTADTATLYDRLPVAAQASAEPISAKFQPRHLTRPIDPSFSTVPTPANFFWIRSSPGQPSNLERSAHLQMLRVEWISLCPFDCYPYSSRPPTSPCLGCGHRIIE